MDCRRTSAHKGRTRLGFKQYEVIFTKEQSVLTKTMSPFEGENIQTQYNVLSRRIDLYFHDYMLAIEIDENAHSDRSIDHEIKRQEGKKQELGCKFIRIDPDKEDFDIFRSIHETFRQIKQSTNKTLINKISTKLLGLEFKPDNITKLKLNFFL